MRHPRWLWAFALVLLLAGGSGRALAEANTLRISRGYGIHYLPLYIVEEQKLIEKHAAAQGLGSVTIEWSAIDGGNNINVAMLSRSLDIASIGVPGFLTLWAKAKGNPQVEVIGLAGVGGGSLYLNSRNPKIKTLADFTDQDRIALPGIKTSYAAFILQMAAAKEFGEENYNKLDHLTVGMPYPEATAALISGRTEITAHVASPPFSYMELDQPGIHRVFNSNDVTGEVTVIMAFTTRQFYAQNPRLIGAFLAALKEAAEFATRDKRGAARIYLSRTAAKTSEEQLMRILDDPDTKFSVAPTGVMKFAEFMSRVGVLKLKPGSWKDLFVPELHGVPGG
jgi:NitT/TauT family transport system substrate-binding protein